MFLIRKKAHWYTMSFFWVRLSFFSTVDFLRTTNSPIFTLRDCKREDALASSSSLMKPRAFLEVFKLLNSLRIPTSSCVLYTVSSIESCIPQYPFRTIYIVIFSIRITASEYKLDKYFIESLSIGCFISGRISFNSVIFSTRDWMEILSFVSFLLLLLLLLLLTLFLKIFSSFFILKSFLFVAFCFSDLHSYYF